MDNSTEVKNAWHNRQLGQNLSVSDNTRFVAAEGKNIADELDELAAEMHLSQEGALLALVLVANPKSGAKLGKSGERRSNGMIKLGNGFLLQGDKSLPPGLYVVTTGYEVLAVLDTNISKSKVLDEDKARDKAVSADERTGLSDLARSELAAKNSNPDDNTSDASPLSGKPASDKFSAADEANANRRSDKAKLDTSGSHAQHDPDDLKNAVGQQENKSNIDETYKLRPGVNDKKFSDK